MFLYKILLYSFIGAMVGVVTNFIAVFSLISPKKRFFGIQGIFERQKEKIAQTIATSLCLYLLNTDDLSKIIHKRKIKEIIKQIVTQNIKHLPKIASFLLTDLLEKKIYNLFFEEKTGNIKVEVLKNIIDSNELESLISNKILSYEAEELKRVGKEILGKDILKVILFGGVPGAIIGFFEAFLPF